MGYTGMGLPQTQKAVRQERNSFLQYNLVKPNYFWFMYSCTLSLCTIASLKV